MFDFSLYSYPVYYPKLYIKQDISLQGVPPGKHPNYNCPTEPGKSESKIIMTGHKPWPRATRAEITKK